MNISTAFGKILDQIPDEAKKKDELKKVFDGLHPIDGITSFSVTISQASLSSLESAIPPTGHIEIDSYLDALTKEIIRAATVLHGSCTCGVSLEEHIYIFFLLYSMQYFITQFPYADKEAVSSIQVNLGGAHDFMKFRPSQN